VWEGHLVLVVVPSQYPTWEPDNKWAYSWLWTKFWLCAVDATSGDVSATSEPDDHPITHCLREIGRTAARRNACWQTLFDFAPQPTRVLPTTQFNRGFAEWFSEHIHRYGIWEIADQSFVEACNWMQSGAPEIEPSSWRDMWNITDEDFAFAKYSGHIDGYYSSTWAKGEPPFILSVCHANESGDPGSLAIKSGKGGVGIIPDVVPLEGILAHFEAAVQIRGEITATPNEGASRNLNHSGTARSSQLPAGSDYALRKGMGVWELTFGGQTAMLKHSKGILYVHYLLYHSVHNPIQAVDLVSRIGGLHGEQQEATAVDHFTEKTVAVERGSALQQLAKGIDSDESSRRIVHRLNELSTVLDDPDASELERKEAEGERAEILCFLREHGKEFEDQAQRTVRAVRRAVTRFQEHLSKATDSNGNPDSVLRRFAEHIDDCLLRPSSRHRRRGRNQPSDSGAGKFTYEPPDHIVWQP